MELSYYVLEVSLRKSTDRGHFHNPDNMHSGEDYFNKEELLEKLDYNNIAYQEMIEDDCGILKPGKILVIVQDCLEERLIELINNSIYRILMKTDRPDF